MTVSGISRQEETNVNTVISIIRPASIQQKSPSLLGHPKPLNNDHLVTQRKRKGFEAAATSLDIFDSDIMG